MPTATVFAPDGALDDDGNRRFLSSLSAAGVDHLFVLGSLGEFPLLDESERARLVRVAVDAARGPTDVWVGVGAPSTRQAIRYARDAASAGASALVAVPPYYLHPTAPAIARYYRSIAAEVDLPLLAYNIPSLVGYALSPALVHALGAEGTLRGTKDTSGSLASVRAFLTGRPDGFHVLPGDDALALESMAIGASGAIMGMGNLVPRLCAALVRTIRSGSLDSARPLQQLIDRLVDVSRAGPFPATDKYLANKLWGAPAGYRSPYDPLTADEAAEVDRRLAPLRPDLAPYLGARP